MLTPHKTSQQILTAIAMQTWKLAALLILQCWLPLIACQNSQLVDLGSSGGVGTVQFKGEKLQVYEIEGAQFAEPRIGFDGACGTLEYNHLYRKYQLTLPFSIDSNTLKTPIDTSKKAGNVVISGIQVKVNSALGSKDSGLKEVAELVKSGEAQLLLLCNSFERCRRLKDEVAMNPDRLRLAVSFVLSGRVDNSLVKFGEMRSASAPRFHCHHNRWVVFQRRVDGSMSFAQSWDSYAKGFGNPSSNYWMGLNLLSYYTVTGLHWAATRCQLRIDVEDHHGGKFWGVYKQFQVLGPEFNYRLYFGQLAHGSTIGPHLEYHNGKDFSTFDRDNDQWGHSCSKYFGYGGWWFGACAHFNPNGAYIYDKTKRSEPSANSAVIDGRHHLPLKTTKMMFKCE